MVFHAFARWRRRRILARSALPVAAWEAQALQWGFVAVLDPDERRRLREAATLFLQDKHFSTVSGAAPSEALCWSVATQACILILNLDLDYYRGFREIIFYPSAFVPKRQVADEFGVVHESEELRIGEAWQRGPVLLSVEDLEQGVGASGNLVIHEFAHQIDMANGGPNGFPRLHREMSRARWSGAFLAAYEDLCRRVDADEYVALDDYAAESPAEFFAVASEVFFEDPQRLSGNYPEVYTQLVAFYRQDPGMRARLALGP